MFIVLKVCLISVFTNLTTEYKNIAFFPIEDLYSFLEEIFF